MPQLLPIFAMIATVLHTPPDLRPSEWHDRVIVAFAPAESDPQLQQQLQWLEKAKSGLEERDVRVFAIIGASQPIEDFRSHVHCPGSAFAVVLIGKDGGAKLHKSQPVTADEVFSTIDQMPMRRDEMRQKT